MRRILNTATIALLAATSVIAGSLEERPVAPKSEQDARTTIELRATVAALDHRLSNGSSRIRLFARLADKNKSEKQGYLVPSNKIVKVRDSKRWPQDTVTSYLVLTRDDGSVAAFQEVPVSESGDWFNAYTHYYDERGSTIAFQRYSSFFTGCSDSPSSETSIYYFQGQRLIAKDYFLNGKNNRKLDPGQCQFMYRHNYTIRRTWMESCNASGIGQAW